jgi:hypothetical protein
MARGRLIQAQEQDGGYFRTSVADVAGQRSAGQLRRALVSAGEAALTSDAPTLSQAPLLALVEELPEEQLEEGSDIWAYEVTEALRRQTPVVAHVTRPGRALVAPATRFLGIRTATRRAVRQAGRRPRAALYVPAGRMVTRWALLRARYLRSLLQAPVAMAAFHDGLPSAASRWAPDLLLLTTQAACEEAERSGVRAEFIWSGADTARFRPPGAGERLVLRRKWGIDTDSYVVFHVGHLFENRNLRALIPLAAQPGVSVVVLASHYRREPESSTLCRHLEEGGVRLLFGHRPDVEEIYRLSDCYVFPTVDHGGAVASPLSVVEAKATGLPVVARRFRALGERVGRELQIDLVDSDEELRGRVLALRNGTARPAGADAPLADAFSWQGVARRLVELIDRPDPARAAGLPVNPTGSMP